MKTFESLVDALADLKSRGYNLDFVKEPTCLYCYVFDLWITPEQFNVDEVHRFEEDSNPDDSSVIYAISSYSGMKGTLIDSYGVYAEHLTFENGPETRSQLFLGAIFRSISLGFMIIVLLATTFNSNRTKTF